MAFGGCHRRTGGGLSAPSTCYQYTCISLLIPLTWIRSRIPVSLLSQTEYRRRQPPDDQELNSGPQRGPGWFGQQGVSRHSCDSENHRVIRIPCELFSFKLGEPVVVLDNKNPPPVYSFSFRGGMEDGTYKIQGPIPCPTPPPLVLPRSEVP